TFDPCQPLQLIAVGATADQLAAIDSGVALWGMPGVGRDITAADALEVTFESASPAMYGFYQDEIYINEDLAGSKAAITFAHQLGHAFGLVHVPIGVRPSVMNPGNLTVEPTTGDDAALVALWGTCP